LYEKEERNKERKKMTKSGFSGSLFLSSRNIKGAFTSMFVNWYQSICILALGYIAAAWPLACYICNTSV